MTWWAVDVTSTAGEREAVAAWLVARTGHAVQERDDGGLVGFVSDPAEADALDRDLGRAFPGEVRVTVRAVEPVDWGTRWRDGLRARRIGRLTLAPSWLPAQGGAVVVVDPETAFGSGEHGSTRTALALMEAELRPGDLVLDLGAGSGILAIAAVTLGARRAIGIEMDPEAIEVAERNAVRNRVADRVTFLQGDAAHLAPLAGPAELVCANILREINVALLPEIGASLHPGGTAVFAGMELGEAHLFLPALAGAGWRVWREVADEGWWGVAARRP
jgi:ribosomal protein L11 methyltransferase